MNIKDEQKRRITAAANVVDVIGDFYELEKRGKEFTCLCPFHDDHHLGSFMVNESKNIFQCFSCGAGGDSIDFLMKHEGYTFTEAIQWLGRKYGIEVEGSEKFSPKPCEPHKPAPKLPVYYIPLSVVDTMRDYTTGSFSTWLRSLPWSQEQNDRIDKMMKNYAIGYAKKQGMTVFWQIDEEGRVCNGKMMRYNADGHRCKNEGYNVDFAASILARANYYNKEEYDSTTCYFGQHLTRFCPSATINIVESEKSALVLAIAYGNMTDQIWMACGGKSSLTRERLRPFIEGNRYVVLHPDKDAAADWKTIAREIGYDRLFVSTSFIEKHWTEADGPKADPADIIIRILSAKPETTSQKVHQLLHLPEENKALTQLIENLKLKII